MEVGDVTRWATALQQQETNAAVQLSVLKKIEEVSEATAMSLLAALPQPPANNPPHLGQQVDLRA
ncbi:MAG: YjfB family protein [Hydrogenophilus sp.]|nr:YjfB family protein [Hydrogenophilus sp.]